MPDELPPQDAASVPELESEDINNNAATVSFSSQETEESSSVALFLLKIWNMVMFVSTTALCIYLFILKDNSVVPFIILGIIGLCIPPVVGMFRSRARRKRLQIEHEIRMEEARQERIQQAKEREMARLQRERMLAVNEEAIQEAIRNTDVEAFKLKNSMEITPPPSPAP